MLFTIKFYFYLLYFITLSIKLSFINLKNISNLHVLGIVLFVREGIIGSISQKIIINEDYIEFDKSTTRRGMKIQCYSRSTFNEEQERESLLPARVSQNDLGPWCRIKISFILLSYRCLISFEGGRNSLRQIPISYPVGDRWR